MREKLTDKEDEVKGLKQELEVSHRQFFKLLHHVSSVKNDGNQSNNEGKELLALSQLHSMEDLEQMRKQLKLLERNFKF